uniref:Uncharacterized protein n=1 Tax=Citrus limon TaxID=2708 RepID=A0A1S8ACV8_CITLI
MSLSTSYSSLLSINSQLEHNQKLKTNHKLRWRRSTSSQHTTTIFLNNQRCASLKTNAIADSLILGATSPAKSGDIREFLITSAGLFFLYWISNFVVPNLLTKYFQFDKVNEDQEQKPGDKRS